MNKRDELIAKIDNALFYNSIEYKKIYTKEVGLQNQVIRELKKIFKDDIWFAKISDRYNKGIPDIVGCINGMFFGLELKRGTGRPSKLQLYTIDKIKKAGGGVCIARTMEDCLLIIKSSLMTYDMQ